MRSSLAHETFSLISCDTIQLRTVHIGETLGRSSHTICACAVTLSLHSAPPEAGKRPQAGRGQGKPDQVLAQCGEDGGKCQK